MKYTIISISIAVLGLFIFFRRFERRKIRTRRLVIIAVMTALSVLGRVIFSVIPAFKPISAVVIITAVWLGPECGFMTGALSALISNMYFGQGPWTPFQMLAWGLIGVLAGLLSKPLKKSRAALGIFGFFAGAGFSMIMDIWTVMWFSSGFSWPLYIGAVAAAAPHTAVYAASNVVFLLLLGRPFGEKLERVIVKYGV